MRRAAVFTSGLLVSVITALGGTLVLFERLSGPLPFVVGAVGGLLAVPVLAAQAVALRLERRRRPLVVAVAIPWTVAPLAALALAGGARQLVPRALSAWERSSSAARDSCGAPPTLGELAAGRWTAGRDAEGRARLGVRLQRGTSIRWAATAHGDERITMTCE